MPKTGAEIADTAQLAQTKNAKESARRKTIEKELKDMWRKEHDPAIGFLVTTWQKRIKEKTGIDMNRMEAEFFVRLYHRRISHKAYQMKKFISLRRELDGLSKEDAEKEAQRLTRAIFQRYAED